MNQKEQARLKALNSLPADEERYMKDVVFRVASTDTGAPIPGAAVLAAYSNKTYRTGQTDDKGECRLDLYRTDDQMIVCVAANGHLPFHTVVVPQESENDVAVKLELSKQGLNGILFTGSTGYIPGITGRLNPHGDGRYYVYGDNIAINGRLAHPAVDFSLGQSLHLTDANGMETHARFLVVEGQFSLIEYTDPKPYSGTGH